MNLLESFQTTRHYTESLCAPLSAEDCVVQLDYFASPTKWHLAHTTWFFETFVLRDHASDYQIFDDSFNFLFNSYYNHAGKRLVRTNRGNITRPSLDQVYAYRSHVDQAIEKLIDSCYKEEVNDIIILGINHEQQHQELLLTDIKYLLGHNPLFPAYDINTNLLDQEPTSDEGFVTMENGLYQIGYNDSGFHYDNEVGVHQVFLHDFQINQSLVSNGAYIEFIEDGAYTNFDLWLDEGWHWLKENQVKAPLYWHHIDGQWHHYTLKGLLAIEASDVLKHLNYYEACAFAEWSGMRLPTEFEWEASSHRFQWGQRWEWTQSAYLPYPAFKKAHGALGEYNGKFMVNQMVLRGSSLATSQNHSRRTYRNFFHPQHQWQFTGIRLAQSL